MFSVGAARPKAVEIPGSVTSARVSDLLVLAERLFVVANYCAAIRGTGLGPMH